MIPLSDGMPPRRFPIVTTAIIVVNVAVWLFYELPSLNSAIEHASFYPCTIDGSCDGPEPWWISWVTSMFLHGSWDHILGNMLFLAVFGKNVEDRFGRLPYLLFYFAGGLAATVTQTAVTLIAGTSADAQTPNLGASGAIAAVLGAYFILFPGAQIRGLIGFWPVKLSAMFFLGFWFLYQLFEANFGLFESSAHGGGVAFFAHVGGFVFGAVIARALLARGRLQDDEVPRRVWA
jgi:membrane associated rhomboid family serine protease